MASVTIELTEVELNAVMKPVVQAYLYEDRARSLGAKTTPKDDANHKAQYSALEKFGDAFKALSATQPKGGA